MEISKTAREIFKLNQLTVSQNDGVARTGTGEVVGRQKWIVNVDYSLDTEEGMLKGMVFVNFAKPKGEFDGR